MDEFEDHFLNEYRDLRSLAAKHLRKMNASTLQPTALVHEVYLKLLRATDTYADRALKMFRPKAPDKFVTSLTEAVAWLTAPELAPRDEPPAEPSSARFNPA